MSKKCPVHKDTRCYCDPRPDFFSTPPKPDEPQGSIRQLNFRELYEGKQDFPNPPFKGCPDDLSAIEYIVECKINELIGAVNKLTEDKGV